MSERNAEGAEIEGTGRKEWEFDYQPSDMESAYRHSNPHNWDVLIDWLEAHAEAEKRFTPGEAVAIVEDLRRARDAQVQFTTDPEQAYRMAHKYRAENNRKYAAQHAQAIERARR